MSTGKLSCRMCTAFRRANAASDGGSSGSRGIAAPSISTGTIRIPRSSAAVISRATQSAGSAIRGRPSGPATCSQAGPIRAISTSDAATACSTLSPKSTPGSTGSRR